MVIYFLLALGVVFVFLVFVFVILPLFVGAAYEPSRDKSIAKMLEFAGDLKGKKVAELGSGDGKVVIAFAERGAEVVGWEINPFLVWISRYRIRRRGLSKKAKIYWMSFWNVNLRDFDVVVAFQVFYVMPRLARKLKKELRDGAKFISNNWKVRSWNPEDSDEKIYLYLK